jgi:predicted  nucleic acid-binding Zn-ribbon protein
LQGLARWGHQQERTSVSREDELTALREEVESLADFLRMLLREHTQLHRDFAAALRAAGGMIAVTDADFTNPVASDIERAEDPKTGAVTFRLTE